jgi:hypothetical protein
MGGRPVIEWPEVVAIGTQFPDVEEGTCFGTPALRLDVVSREQLTELLEDAWRLRAPKRVLAAYDASKA